MRPASRGAAVDPSIPVLFQRWVRETPEAVAVELGQRKLTYRELDAAAHRVARALVQTGSIAESIVAVAAERSLDWVAAVLGVVQAGAAYLPIDADYPAERIRFIVSDSGCATVLTDSTTKAKLPELTAPVQELPVQERPELRAGAVRLPEVRSAQSAYVIYTSGSTGQPKGVAVTHSGMEPLVAQARRHLRIEPGSRVLQASSPAFDTSVWELFATLLSGATLVLAKKEELEPGRPLAGTIDRNRVTHVALTPSVVVPLRPEWVPDLQCLIVAGDTTNPDLVATWAPGRTMINAYGPSETTVCASMSGPLTVTGKTPPIGRPVEKASIQVLDGRLGQVRPGSIGELYVAGPALGRGYLRRPKLTAERFVANPFGGSGERMYRTGDLASWTAGSELMFHGRADSQIKIHGVRIEPHEVEAVLTGHPGVSDALVTSLDLPQGKQLVAYVVPAAETGLSTSRDYGSIALDSDFVHSELRELVLSRLPAPFVPAAFVTVERIPLTLNGKPDLSALPEPAPRHTEYRAARNEIEESFAAYFAEVLGLGQVGIDDDFFAIGGDSIQSIQVVSRARRHGVEVSAREIFEKRTAAALAALVASRSTSGAVPRPPELEHGSANSFPLLPVAQWIRGRGAGFNRFLQAMVVQLPEGIDSTTLTATLRAVLEHHDMFRLRLMDDEIVLKPQDTAEPAVDRVEWTGEWGAEWQAIVRRELERVAVGLNPATGDVARFVWFDGDPGRLLIALHHLVIDGVSWRILLADLEDAWAAVREGRRPELPEAGTSPGAWAYALVEEARSSRRAAELPLWRSILTGPASPLGTRSLDPGIDTMETVVRASMSLPAAVTESLLTAVPAAFRAEVMDGLTAGLALALAKWRSDKGMDESSLLLHVEGHGREEEAVPGAELSRTVGWFTTVFPIRLDLAGADLEDAFDGGAAAGKAVKITKELFRSIPDKGLGYGLLKHLNPGTAAELDGWPLGQICFNYLGRFAPTDVGAWSQVEVPALTVLDAAQDPEMPASASLEVTALLKAGPEGVRLHAVLAAPSGLLSRDELTALAGLLTAAWTGLARHARAAASSLTPSDVLSAPVAQDDLDRWAREHPGLADVWPLMPLQAGLLFHSLHSNSGADAYQMQYVLRLAGDLDPDRMRAAAQALQNRHAGLRTTFAPDSRGELFQLVLESAELPWETRDLSGLDAAERNRSFERFLAEDLRDRFALGAPPMVRMTLIRMSEGESELVLTVHHAILDGWSVPVLVRDLLLLYGSEPSELSRAGNQKDFLAWYAKQDKIEAEEAWKRELDGARPTLVGDAAGRPGGTDTIRKAHVPLDASDSRALVSAAADLGVTANTVFQAAWGMLLSQLTGREDIIFGAAVSGRSSPVPGIETVVGMLLNTVPVRVDCAPERTVGGLIVALQARQAALVSYQHHGLSELQQLTRRRTLFDTMVSFESFPLDRAGIAQAGESAGVSVTGIRAFTPNHYPLSLVVYADSESPLRAVVHYQSHIFDAAAAASLADRLAAILRQVGKDVEKEVGALVLEGAAGDASVADIRRRRWNAK